MTSRSNASFLDASVIVRYLTADAGEPAERAREIIEEHPNLTITTDTISECGYVMTRLYGIGRQQVVDSLLGLLNLTNITIYRVDKSLAVQALRLCRPSGRVSFADAMLWATALASGSNATVFTLDRRFPSDGIDVRSRL